MLSRLSLRYLAVGAFNTGFGYGLFALLTYLLNGSYIIASLLANLVAITVAFLGYKWFVFKTKGNYLKEWLRCVSVYGTMMLFTLAMLPIVVTLLKRIVDPKLAPYIAGALLTGCTVVMSFFSHKRFSFAVTSETSEAVAQK